MRNMKKVPAVLWQHKQFYEHQLYICGSVLFSDNNKKKKRSTQDLPFIYQSAPPAVSCTNAASTSIISGSKAVDFASFAIGKNKSIIGLILPLINHY